MFRTALPRIGVVAQFPAGGNAAGGLLVLLNAQQPSILELAPNEFVQAAGDLHPAAASSEGSCEPCRAASAPRERYNHCRELALGMGAPGQAGCLIAVSTRTLTINHKVIDFGVLMKCRFAARCSYA